MESKEQTIIVQGETYYKAQKAQEILGMTYSALRNQVNAGNVKSVTPPGRRQAVYRAEDVNGLANAIGSVTATYKATPPTSRPIIEVAKDEQDIKETVQIARQNFGDNAYDLDRRMSWFRIVPNGDYVLRHDNVIVGYFSIQPIKQDAVNEIFRHKTGRGVKLDDLEPMVPGRSLEVHISAIAVKKGISRQDARDYGIDLVKGMFSTLVELGKQGIQVDKIWAKSSTVPGIKLCRGLGFNELGYINEEQIGFVLETTNENVSMPLVREALQKYREAMNVQVAL